MTESSSSHASRRRAGLRWLRGVSILAAASAVAWLLAVRWESPWAAACVVAAAVGWVLCRLARMSSVGTGLWCLAVVALSAACWASLPGTTDELRWLGWLTGLATLIASGVAFLVAAGKNPTRRVRNCAGTDLALFTLIAWVVGSVTTYGYLREQEAVQHTTETLVKLHQLDVELEAIQSRLGRLPKDEEELVALRGKPMPTFRKPYRVTYRWLGSDRYELHCMLTSFWGHHWDIGWIVLFYGSTSARPIQVVMF